MFGGKVTTYYRMSEEQFEEMKKFYETLGYNKKQVKKLCGSCFGSEIRVEKNAAYSENWSFYRNIEHKFTPPARGKASGRAVADSYCEEDGMAEPMMFARSAMAAPMMSAPMMGGAQAAMPAPGMGMGMAMMPMSEPAEFNTAETHNAPENEEHSPLDQEQAIFSANVNTASWNYLRSRIARGKSVDPSFVRIEEIINSYRYKLKKPDNNELFSVSAESGACPWNDDSELLFLGFKGKKADKECRQNLSLLVDVSGSMDDQWILVQMSMAAIMSKLKKGDKISVIAYSDETKTVVKQMDCEDPDECVKAICSVDGIGGCTNGSEGLENAYNYLQKHFDENANNRVYIFTDGDFNFGLTSEGSLKDFISKKRESGIYLSIVGYGESNFKDNKMETLAQNGNGNYTFVSNPYDILDDLWEKLVSQLVTVAKNVKISVSFNPMLVKEYRLIGYDARKLTQQEFHDTEKATDGIGSSHNVVALLELKRGKAEKKFASRYTNTSVEGDQDELAFVEVHYQSPDGENLVMTKSVMLSELKEAKRKNLTAAALLAGFGLLVKDSEYKGDMSKEKLAVLLKETMTTLEEEKPEKWSHLDIIRRYVK